MLKAVSVIRHVLIRGLEWFLIVLMGVLILDVIWQVATRYILSKPSQWTDELATMLLIWVSLLGAAVVFVEQGHLGVDYFVGKVPEKPRAIIEFLSHVLVALFAASILIYGGYHLVMNTLQTGQTSPALQFKMWIVYLVLPLSGCFIFVFACEAAGKATFKLRRSEQT